jgi:hypothetical protein
MTTGSHRHECHDGEGGDDVDVDVDVDVDGPEGILRILFVFLIYSRFSR